jgi:hypothetical protein
MRKRFGRVVFTAVVVVGGLGIAGITSAHAAPQGTFDVTSSIPSAYPSCSPSASISVTWSHLNTKGDRGKVVVYMAINEIPTGGLVASSELPGNASRGNRTLSAPTAPASDPSYGPNFSASVLIFPGSDTSKPYIRIAQWSLGNVPGCTAVT